MKNYTCIIVDDEPLSREVIEDFVKEYPELQLAGQFSNAIDAREFLKESEIDLIFLDINMPRFSGVDFVKTLANPPAIIFITAYAEFAVDGFELEAIDYLLKPVSQERFQKAVSRFLEKMGNNKLQESSIMVKADKKLYRLEMDDILYVEAMGDYIRIITADKTLTVYDRLTTFLEKLPASQFCRIHKSYLVAVSKIEFIEGNKIKIGDTHLPVSATYKDQLIKLFEP